MPPNDPRIKDFLKTKTGDPKVVLIGFPSDEGVKRNGGRPGAANATDKIRKALYTLTPGANATDDFLDLLSCTQDNGNIEITGDLEADQERLGKKVAHYLKNDTTPIILGGGHGTAFGHFLGYVKTEMKTSIFNLDAHTDVRPLKEGKAHSGSPFRQAIEHRSGCCTQYNVAGLQPHAVASSHRQFVEQHGGTAIFNDETDIHVITKQLVNLPTRCMVTFDMDAVDQAFAPGVSAPCTNGVKPELWFDAAYQAGKSGSVTSFDIAEVNPIYDRDNQTTRLAALTVWHFLKGRSESVIRSPDPS